MNKPKSNTAQAVARQKEPVHLREKKLANGNVSLYLDKYQNGERSYEFLKLYLVNPITATDRIQNKATLDLAHTIKAERILEIQKQNNGHPVYKLDYSFIEHVKKMMIARYNSKGNYENWDSALQHMQIFTKGKDVTFREVDTEWLTRFKGYLTDCKVLNSDKKLAPNSAYSYYNKVRAALRQAFEEGFIPVNPASRVRGLPQAETNRENLTLEEVQAIIAAECDDKQLKRAFLFSVFTGLRWSDVTTITWRQVEQSELTGDFIRFKQVKTKGREFLPITEQARSILGERKDAGAKIFEGLVYSANTSLLLSKWMVRAGVDKHITFHSARHTHATLLLTLGVDLYVLSKMLGHKKISTTEIYTKVVNVKKIEAANRIPQLDLGNI